MQAVPAIFHVSEPKCVLLSYIFTAWRTSEVIVTSNTLLWHLCSVAGVRMVSSMVAVWDTAATATISFDTSPSSRMQAVLAKLAGLFAVHSQSLLGSGHTLEEQQHEEIF